MVTYAIGFSVTPSDLERNPDLRFSQSNRDTGVLVSWNTTMPEELESDAYRRFITWTEGALVTNPLTWSTDETPAAAVPFSMDYAHVFGRRFMEGDANAIVDNTRGLLLVTTAGVDLETYPEMVGGLLSRYHNSDIWFFSHSISQNIKDRVAAFLTGQVHYGQHGPVA